MEDELLYSYIGSIADANGVSANTFYQTIIRDPNKDTLTNITNGAGYYLGNLFQWMDVNPLEFFFKTSIYPGYAPLLKRNEQNRMINTVFRGRRVFPGLITNQHSDIPSLKYCPLCVRNDYQNKGFSWFRRAHQMPGVQACFKHGVMLQISKGSVAKYHIPPVDPPDCVEATAIKNDYAVFAKDFLDASLNTDADILRSIIGKDPQDKSIGKTVSKYGITAVDDFLNRDTVNYIRLINTSAVYIKPERLLKALFITFSSVSDIPFCKDLELLATFSQASRNYIVFKPFASTAVLMQKKESGNFFITTPDAFLAGWRDPKDDVGKTEEEKFKELLDNVKSQQYKLISPFTSLNDKIDLYHERCGEIYTVRAKAILEEGSDCKCCGQLLESDIRRLFEKDISFDLLQYDVDKKVIQLYGRECGHTFKVSYRAWNAKRECRVCKKQHYADTGEGFGFLPPKKSREEFERQVRDLVGDEYRVVSEYHGTFEPVNILHLKCNKTFECRPTEFLRGKRCRCRTLPDQESFIRYVSERSLGKYECRWNRSVKKYMIIDSNTGETVVTWPKVLIMQELERPTLSPILPLDKKGEFIPSKKKSIVDIVEQYLVCHYLRGDVFSLENININGLEYEQIRHAMDGIAKKGIVAFKGNKHYKYLGSKIMD